MNDKLINERLTELELKLESKLDSHDDREYIRTEIKELDIDICMLSSLSKQQFSKRIAICKQKFKTMSGPIDKVQDPHDILLAKTNESTKVLEETLKVLHDTEQVGIDTLRALQKQRDTMARVKENLNTTQQSLKHSDSVLTRMMRFWRG
jgi:hypothetical protein